jgi:hypothetical protein
MNVLKITLAAIAAAPLLAGCAMTSGVMEAEGGTYMISAHAAPARGGAAGATQAAYSDAQKFCAGQGKRPIVLTAQERDINQGGMASSWNTSGGFIGGGVAAAGNANLHFKCA